MKFYDKLFEDIKYKLTPNEFKESIFDIDYPEKYQKGIRYILFDLDGTIVPFDSMEIDNNTLYLINMLKEYFNLMIYSDGSEKRVIPISRILDIPYIYRATKPFGSFDKIKYVMGEECTPEKTMLVGNISYLDTPFAVRNNIYNVLVDTIHNNNIKDKICDIPQKMLIKKLK